MTVNRSWLRLQFCNADEMFDYMLHAKNGAYLSWANTARKLLEDNTETLRNKVDNYWKNYMLYCKYLEQYMNKIDNKPADNNCEITSDWLISSDWLINEAQQMLIDREISDKEMKCVKKLIEKWTGKNR